MLSKRGRVDKAANNYLYLPEKKFGEVREWKKREASEVPWNGPTLQDPGPLWHSRDTCLPTCEGNITDVESDTVTQ
jgi:hypothetical protein